MSRAGNSQRQGSSRRPCCSQSHYLCIAFNLDISVNIFLDGDGKFGQGNDTVDSLWMITTFIPSVSVCLSPTRVFSMCSWKRSIHQVNVQTLPTSPKPQTNSRLSPLIKSVVRLVPSLGTWRQPYTLTNLDFVCATFHVGEDRRRFFDYTIAVLCPVCPVRGIDGVESNSRTCVTSGVVQMQNSILEVCLQVRCFFVFRERRFAAFVVEQGKSGERHFFPRETQARPLSDHALLTASKSSLRPNWARSMSLTRNLQREQIATGAFATGLGRGGCSMSEDPYSN